MGIAGPGTMLARWGTGRDGARVGAHEQRLRVWELGRNGHKVIPVTCVDIFDVKVRWCVCVGCLVVIIVLGWFVWMICSVCV